jgi:sugar O-acyltransferase (sialic acid O-acetyltransferase NeuD family)
MNTEAIAIYGASGFGREVAWLVESCQDNRIVVCFIDDDEKKQGTDLNGIPIVGLKQAAERYADAKVIGGIGNPKIRETLMKKAARYGFNFGTVIHPRVEMSKWVHMGIGTVICAGNIFTTNIRLGEHVQINLSCTIGHDVVLEDYVTLAPGVHISGCVQCGKRVSIGTGAVIINGTPDESILIGDDSVIGAGACVTKSIPYGQTWGGVPAKVIKKTMVNPVG